LAQIFGLSECGACQLREEGFIAQALHRWREVGDILQAFAEGQDCLDGLARWSVKNTDRTFVVVSLPADAFRELKALGADGVGWAVLDAMPSDYQSLHFVFFVFWFVFPFGN